MSEQLLKALIENLLIPVFAALSVWIVTKIPGPARRALDATAERAEAETHARDLALVASILAKRAVVEVANHATPPPTADQLLAYLERIKPDLMAKLGQAPEQLATTAEAAIVTASVAAPVLMPQPKVE